MRRPLKFVMLACCLALTGSSHAAAADVVLDMTGRITPDCLVNSGLGIRFRYDHAPNQLCHLAEATASGPLLNLSWPTPLCKESPDDKRCLEWSAGGCCVWCGARSGQHTQEETRGTSLAPGSYTEAVSAAPFVEGGASVMGSFAFNWTQSGNINDTRVCAGDSAGFTLNPGETWSVTLIVPDLGQTTRLEKNDGDNGDGQKAFLGAVLPKPLSVKASATNNVGTITSKGGLTIVWTVKDSAGNITSQFESRTADETGISQVTVSLGMTAGPYTITAECAACTANQIVTFTANAIPPPKVWESLPVPAGLCTAWVEPPPPHEVCINEPLTLHCQCHPVSGQRSVIWSTPSPGQITSDPFVPENATFISSQEGDFPVNLTYFPNTSGAPSCNSAATVKVRDARIASLKVMPSFMAYGVNLARAQVGEKFELHVHLTRPITGPVAYISVQGGQTIITPKSRNGSDWKYEVYLPIEGAGSIVVKGCSNSAIALDIIVDKPIPWP